MTPTWGIPVLPKMITFGGTVLTGAELAGGVVALFDLVPQSGLASPATRVIGVPTEVIPPPARLKAT